jgi:hypothetical protein
MEPVDYEPFARKARLTAREMRQVWDAAARFDDSLALRPKLTGALATKRIEPMPYSRSQLFERMRLCKPSLFSNFPLQQGSTHDGLPSTAGLVDELRSGFPRAKRARVRIREAIEYLPIPKVLDRWMRAKSVFGVTDLHYIGTRFDARVDTRNLNDFNLLPRGTQGFQSQDSLVISSCGAVSDSHSDDHSGSNHCFTGTKLWLLWDTLEGLEHGLEDAEHCEVFGRAAFDLPAFSAMSSSRWILIGPGQTMFIPGNLTHKVITLQRYLGLGSFHAGLPGFVDLLMRWKHLPPIWASRSAAAHSCSVEFITRRAIRRIRSLRKASRSERHRWGLPYLKMRLQSPDLNPEAMKRGSAMRDDANLRAFIHAAWQLT